MTLQLFSSWLPAIALSIFFIGYALVIAEEHLAMRKSKPMVLAAGLLWMLLRIAEKRFHLDLNALEHFNENLLEYAHLFFFLFVSMTYVNALSDLNIFSTLRSRLIDFKLSYRQLFWMTGALAFFISPIADNLTTALVMGAVLLAVGKDNPNFIGLGCINIVVAANAGGAFSPFGDITTLLVWQQGLVPFGGFFKIFIPALVNFVVPAALMSPSISNAVPQATDERVELAPGALIVLSLFLLTILTAVLCHHFLDLPPTFGMMLGLAYLQLFTYWQKHVTYENKGQGLNVFQLMERIEWDTLLFFYGVMFCVGALSTLGVLEHLSSFLYGTLGTHLPQAHQATPAHIIIGLISAVMDNIPVMVSVLKMNPPLSEGQWLLVTLTAGVGGSLLSIGSAAGVALMGQARQHYTFMTHLRWTWAIALGYILSITAHCLINNASF